MKIRDLSVKVNVVPFALYMATSFVMACFGKFDFVMFCVLTGLLVLFTEEAN